MRGRKPKPTAKKRLAGNPGKRALNDREPHPRVSPDAQPAQIIEGCQAFTARYLPLLKEMKVFTDVDLAAFELMSVHYVVAIRAAAIVENSGLVQYDEIKQAHKNPILQVLRDSSRAFREYAAEFGMTPSARVRIEVGDGEEIDELELELFGAGAEVRE